MIRRIFLKLFAFASLPFPGDARRKNLDALIADYNRRFEAVYNISENVVCYERDTWNGVREAFTKIIEAVR